MEHAENVPYLTYDEIIQLALFGRINDGWGDANSNGSRPEDDRGGKQTGNGAKSHSSGFRFTADIVAKINSLIEKAIEIGYVTREDLSRIHPADGMHSDVAKLIYTLDSANSTIMGIVAPCRKARSLGRRPDKTG